MRFNSAAFNNHLANIGQKCIWQRSYTCPCINPNSGSPSPSCPRCGGRGKFWIEGVPTVVGIASQKVQQNWAKLGLWESGDSVVSVPEDSPMYEIGQGDRVLMMNGTDRFSVPLIRGAPNEFMRLPVEKIERVFWFDTNSREVEGSIPTIGANGALIFGANAPPLGKTYTLTGTRYAEYYCYQNFPSDRNQHQGMRLPKLVVMRHFDLFGRVKD